ncbi:hypothetical protein M422DRAFT_25171 [Sphaerobolus stellatus SS14]|nr:hypothetical protein M422DRAFT_25171 [Sphaerobolus stellatus SS14]
MDGWRDILHFDFHGEHVLISGLRLSSWYHFIITSVLAVALCALEKYLSFLLSPKSKVFRHQRSPLRNALMRAGVYWAVTLIRLLYMLLAMTFHVGLIIVVVTTLTAGQFVIDFIETPHHETKQAIEIEDIPLLRRVRLDSPSEYQELPQSQASDYPPLPLSREKHTSKRQNGGTRSDVVFSIGDGDENT